MAPVLKRYLRLIRLGLGPTMRTCTDCGQTKIIDGFQRIKACKAGWYGRCRDCRNARKRARYRSNGAARAAEIARSTRNRQKRRRALALAEEPE